ncbi:restriction endonuclease subunit S [Cupriavidus sp. IK-TO18]|uniref:restriction endonuclease subunit S n=1 Tax=Cupriavidus sp. IK-TO18 TaxID=2782182 RepID=UPI00189AA715|nr:restriction endonuclease subunit S [Cupriavidus sp. IK-TO18]MBF6986485.1 restriction endonuclease subunit S [Cupriavidus sp. IK-TO18]
MSAVQRGWRHVFIKNCCEILDGKRKPLNSVERLSMKGEIPYYGANGVVDYINNFIFDEDLILMAEDGGNFSDFRTRPIAYKISGKSWVNNHAHVLRAKPLFNQNFLFYSLEHKNILPVLNGGTRAKLNKSELEKIEILVPEALSEQEKIAAILTTVDDKLDVIARQIKATQTLKQGLMQALFSRGMGVRDAGDWPTVALHEVAEIRTGVAKGKKGLKKPVKLPYLRVANVQDGHIDISEVKTIEVEAAQVERYALRSGDVLMTEGGDFDKLGRGDVWEGQISPCLHQNHVFAVRPDPGKLDSYYLAALAASDYGRQYFLSCAKRTTNLASINSSQLKAFPVLLPSLAVQKNIAEIAGAANAKVAVLEEKQTFYQTLKRGLMQKLLTGEWRVKMEAVMLEADAEATA